MKTFLLTLLFTFVCLINFSFAQWSNNSSINNPVSRASGNQWSATSVSDGAGGVIITWTDLRSGSNYDIYAQRISVSGTVQWTSDGTEISTAPIHQEKPVICSDGEGGAIIVWEDERNSNTDIFAQRIGPTGLVQWLANGVAISTSNDKQIAPAILSDGTGGAFIVWEDWRNGVGNIDIYSQRMSANGTAHWTANGVALSTASNGQRRPSIVSDGSGGAIIAWQDDRSGNYDIYVQRINANGVVQWAPGGVAISTASGEQRDPTIISDGSGGAIVAWWDQRNGDYDIYAQRVNTSGVVQWTGDGVAISATSGDQRDLTMVSDGTGGAIIAWDDWRNGVTNIDIYAQRINADGIVQWTANGSDISTIGNIQSGSTIVSDGAGGVIIAWLDQRVSPNITDIYAQRINASGNVQWAEDGIAISTASGDQLAPVIDSDDGSGAIITWTDSRNGATNWDIYAQQVSGAGILGSVTSVGEVQNTLLMFSLEQNYPNPFNPSTSIQYAIGSSQFVTLKVFDVLGKEVATLVDQEQAAGSYEINFDAAGLPSGIYFYKLTTGINSKIKKMTLIK